MLTKSKYRKAMRQELSTDDRIDDFLDKHEVAIIVIMLSMVAVFWLSIFSLVLLLVLKAT